MCGVLGGLYRGALGLDVGPLYTMEKKDSSKIMAKM